MQEKLTDYRATAAECRKMAGLASDRDRDYWLKMEQFWLNKAQSKSSTNAGKV